MRIDPYRIAVFLGTVWGLAFIFLIIDTSLSDPKSFDQSDYISSFYVAGHLFATGQTASLYPLSEDLSFTDSPFDKAAHRLLPGLPTHSTAVFMYTPLVALIFAPFSQLSPNISILAWQSLSIFSLALSAYLLSRTNNIKASDILNLSALYAPVIITLWSGQVSLVIGLLPLAGGYHLLKSDRPFLAGLVWSFMCLKPQFVFVPALVIMTLAFARRLECAVGFAVGILGLIGATFILVPISVIASWFHALQLSDTFFSGGVYKIRDYLVTSLPANLLLLLPTELRANVKWPIYTVAAALWTTGVWFCTALVRSASSNFSKVPLILAVALVLLPITSPYLLYYDLGILLPAGVILFDDGQPTSISRPLKFAALIGWMSINVYMLIFTFFSAHILQPLGLHLVLLGVAAQLIYTIKKISIISPVHH